jgi:hypothetical protein
MSLLAHLGRSSDAMRFYAHIRRHYKKAFGLEPPELHELAQAIRAGRFVTPNTSGSRWSLGDITT